ncbi:MAG TPA: hypothetical protein VLF59_05920 [Candidatus Saccharimonadales bacterium]|nr:hypothetical protein [Candidatus Saccharimonadales bacterium]
MSEEKPSDKPAKQTDNNEQGTTPEAPDSLSDTDTKADTPEAETDPETDKAIDDIVKKEGDDVLKAQDEEVAHAVVMKQGPWERFKNWNIQWWHDPRKRLLSIACIIVVLGVLLAVPFTRYNILGVVLKADVTVKVVDSKSGQPVSGAQVELSGKMAETQANGEAKLHVNTGSGSLKVSKKYYTGLAKGELVAGKNTFKVPLVATGHQVSIKLVDKVSGKPVSGATVTASGAKAKTNAKGMADLVIPSGATTQPATVSYTGYNDAKVTITADGTIAKNTFQLVPAGKLYFLSNLSGKLDVVKTDLDGSNRQTVLAGTGSEDKFSTSLLASRDWKYLALLSKRSGTTASVYLIDTTNGDKLTTIDEGNANFTLVGWSGDRFIYKVHRNTVADGQKNQEALKSFDPTTGHTLLLDQTDGTAYSNTSGSHTEGYAKQYFDSVYLIGNNVVYAKDWAGNGYDYSSGNGAMVSFVSGKSAEVDTIGADGSGHRVAKTFTLSGTIYANPAYPSSIYGVTVESRSYEPQSVYLAFTDSNTTSYYEYEDGKVAGSNLTSEEFYNAPYPTYLLSPSGNSTFWADQRDGKNTLFTGDDDAKNQKTIASLSEYKPYGWFTDNYLLVSKNSSELYIMPASGGTPQKITDYYKPAINYQGYGGGYGGL